MLGVILWPMMLSSANIYTHIHACLHTYIHTGSHSNLLKGCQPIENMQTYIHTKGMHILTTSYLLVSIKPRNIHECMHTYMHTGTSFFLPSMKYTWIHIHMYKYRHTHPHTHKYIPGVILSPSTLPLATIRDSIHPTCM